MVEVEQWTELRRAHFVGKKSIKKLVRETGLSRNTIRQALRSDAPPKYERAPTESVLEPPPDERWDWAKIGPGRPKHTDGPMNKKQARDAAKNANQRESYTRRPRDTQTFADLFSFRRKGDR